MQSDGLVHIKGFVDVTIASASENPPAATPRRKQAEQPSAPSADRPRKRAVSPKRAATRRPARPAKRTTGVFALDVGR